MPISRKQTSPLIKWLFCFSGPVLAKRGKNSAKLKKIPFYKTFVEFLLQSKTA
jgi:hypothetical protein